MPDEPPPPVDAELALLLICRSCGLTWRPSMMGAALIRSYIDGGQRFHASMVIPGEATTCPRCTAFETLIENFRRSQKTRPH
jgi:hypothetical protein